MCVLCPAQASLNWSAHIIRVSDRYIKVQWLETACILLSGDTHVLPFYVCVSGRVDSSVSCSPPPPNRSPCSLGICGSLVSVFIQKEGGRSICDLCRAYIHKYIRTAWVWWHAVGWGPALQAGRSWVRMPSNVIRFFHWHNPSGRTMALGSTQPLMEMSTRNIFWRVKAAVALGWPPII